MSTQSQSPLVSVMCEACVYAGGLCVWRRLAGLALPTSRLSSLVSRLSSLYLASLYLSSLYLSSDRHMHEADDKAGSMKLMTRQRTRGPAAQPHKTAAPPHKTADQRTSDPADQDSGPQSPTTQDTAPTTHKDHPARCSPTYAPNIYPTSNILIRDKVSCD